VQVAGSRYYNPGLGRWTSRDPMGEEGPPLLYRFVGKAPVGVAEFAAEHHGDHQVQAIPEAPEDGIGAPRVVWKRRVPACTIFVAYGHHWRRDQSKGLQNIQWTVDGPCSSIALVACYASDLPNPSPLPGYTPISVPLNPSYSDPPPTLPNELKKATDAARSQAKACCARCTCPSVVIKFEGFGRSLKEVLVWPSPRDEVIPCSPR
jgi:hypothetical protein